MKDGTKEERNNRFIEKWTWRGKMKSEIGRREADRPRTTVKGNVRKFFYQFITSFFIPFGATARIWALAYLHETLRFTSVY
jgi:hypothetical protein